MVDILKTFILGPAPEKFENAAKILQSGLPFTLIRR